MTRLNPSDLDAFVRPYRWRGGRLVRVRFRHRRGQLDIDAVVRVRTTIRDLASGAKVVKLRLRFVDVSECRFQKRPGTSLSVLKDFRLGFFDGTLYATFDSWSLDPTERPKLHDFRGTEVYIGAKDLFWAEDAARSDSPR